MKRTIAAIVFVLAAGMIGAGVTLVLVGNGDGVVEAPAGSLASPSQPPRHVIRQYRVAVAFPDRFEFDSESDGEVRYWDPVSNTRIVFAVKRLRDGTSLQDAVDTLVRQFSRRGNVGPVEYVTDTRAELTSVELFRRVLETSVFLGQDCWGKPLLVYASYIYDRTSTPEDFWLAQGHADFPRFEFAYRCPVRD